MEKLSHHERLVILCILALGLVERAQGQTPCKTDGIYANCKGRSLAAVPKDLPTTLVELDLSYNRLSHIQFDDFASFTHLRALNLSYNNISAIETGSFASNVLLTNLTLFNNSLTEMPSALFEPLRFLQFLDISNNFYNCATLGAEFSMLENLRNLSIGGPLVSKVLKGDFAPIKNISLQRFSLKTMSSLWLYEKGAFSDLNTQSLWLDIALDTNPQALPRMLKDLAGKAFSSLRFRNLFEFTYYTDAMDVFFGLADIFIKELTFYRGKFNENLLRLTLKNVEKSNIQDLFLLSIDFARSLSTNRTDIRINDLALRRLVIKDVTNPDILRFDWTFTWFNKVSHLDIINVNFNFVPCDAWSQMVNVERLDISNNRLLASNLYNLLCQYSELPNLHTFIASDNNMRSLYTLSLLTLTWPKLATLDLTSNYLGALDEVCTWTPQITKLILKDNTLKVGVFKCLPVTVEHLDMSNSLLERLDMDYFNRATKLKVLILSQNKLKFISRDWKCPNLQVLGLEGNSFSVIDKGSFKDLPELRRLTAGDNPYHCTCDLYAFFTETLTERRVSLADWPEEYNCYHPPHLLDTKVEFYNPGRVECDVRLVVAISVSTTAVVVMLCMLLCWRFDVPWYLRTTCSIVQSKYRSRSFHDSRDYNYHAFISYSHSDADWVRGELLYRLESCSPPYRVCIHERDFLPGRWIIDNIIENIESSRKIIFVLSRNFVNSEWCNYELYFAHQRAIGHAFEDVILVVKEKVTMEDLPKRFQKLRKMMRTKTYLEWPSEQNRQHFFWIQLKSILGKANPPVTSQETLSVVSETVAYGTCSVSETPSVPLGKVTLPSS
ncbi:hypothetical protein XENTR_v10022718 [Xenopus tropicalis]|uniref:Toll-like receptor 2 n=1 Tax=Xenopus tropicalis TaxID=8364 RepID=F6PYC2_XENTR|nr:toll-like receptor 2 [Xenopus tropicalis]XP_004920452.1 toll-like receptor 2 [Xenopus tropicalis]XP_004920453.1 toll-like receptor 2 [Xenopus tropicalis]KAE8588737.1 hypothetical protein XENTR_v10022718 [Xenopus tropicalis]|eukprot:XP_004920451.1 PREDICTED: toll-like receptor 2 [Xenopus tropicalis]